MTTNQEYIKAINYMLGEMDKINELLGNKVQEGLESRNTGLKEEAYETCKEVQIKEEQIMEACIESMIRNQPFASDLRAITVAMKISYDLSRVCRYLLDITEIMEDLNFQNCDVDDVAPLLKQAREMLHLSIRALFEHDAKKAAAIIKSDDEIDRKYRMILSKYKDCTSSSGECALFNGLTARIIERMADHATYISHEVIYLVTGRRSYFRE